MNFLDRRTRIWSIVIILGFMCVARELAALDEKSLSFLDENFSEQQIAALIQQLDDLDAKVRAKAAEALVPLGAETRQAVPKLIRLLADDAQYDMFFQYRLIVRDVAQETLTQMSAEAAEPFSELFGKQTDAVQRRIYFVARQIGPNAQALLPQLLTRYKAADDSERATLITTISAIDPIGDAALPLLISAIRGNSKDDVRTAAANALTRSDFVQQVYWKERGSASRWFRQSPNRINAAADALLAALEDKSPAVRGCAAVSLATYPESADRAVPALIRLSHDPASYEVAMSNHTGGQASVDSVALQALASFPTHADQSLSRIVEAMSGDSYVHCGVITKLTQLSKRPLDHLLNLLKLKDPTSAMPALARLGPAASPAIGRLRVLATSDEDEVASWACMTLTCLDPMGHPHAVKNAKEFIVKDQENACTFLQSVGPQAAFAVPLLSEHMHEKDSPDTIDIDVLNTLRAIGPAAIAAAPEMIDGVSTNFSFYLDATEAAIEGLGPQVVPLLIESLKDPNKTPAHCIGCLHVLTRLGPQAAKAIPTIVMLSQSKYPRVREAAAATLGAIKSRPTESLPALDRLSSDPRPFVRAAAVQSCGPFGSDAKSIVPTLVKRLSDDYLDVRVSAIRALQDLGAVAEAAIPHLKELVVQKNVLIRESARNALSVIVKESQIDKSVK